MVELIVTDPRHTPIAAIDSFNLDLAYGDEENDFELLAPFLPDAGAFIGIDGTEYGGIIEQRSSDGSARGRTWHGILAGKILAPDTGQDYLTVNGTAASILNQLFARMGLQDLFEGVSPKTDITINSYRFERYVDAYTGIRAMLASAGAKLHLMWAEGTVMASALPRATYGDTIDSDLLEFDSTRDHRPINHLIGLGEGELRDRAVTHWYADRTGKVSQTQSLFGLDERTAIYDYSSAKIDDLREDTEKKLKELQTQGEISVTLRAGSGIEFDIGDTVTSRDQTLGIDVTATVTKKIIKVDSGVLSVDYEIGSTSTSKSSWSGSAETSSGGGGGGGTVGIVAGDGITITNGNRINAVVTQAKLDAVRTLAEEANTTASGYAEQIGQAQQTAANAVATANQSVRNLNGTSPIHIWRSDDKATATVYADTATQNADGMMSASDKSKLDDISPYANHYTLPAATLDTLGGVKPDGSTITITNDGTITAHTTGSGGGLTFPVGYVVRNTTGENPGSVFGGTWHELPSLGAYTWERIK